MSQHTSQIRQGLMQEYIMRASSFLCDLTAIYTRVDIDMKWFSFCGVIIIIVVYQQSFPRATVPHQISYYMVHSYYSVTINRLK